MRWLDFFYTRSPGFALARLHRSASASASLHLCCIRRTTAPYLPTGRGLSTEYKTVVENKPSLSLINTPATTGKSPYAHSGLLSQVGPPSTNASTEPLLHLGHSFPDRFDCFLDCSTDFALFDKHCARQG